MPRVPRIEKRTLVDEAYAAIRSLFLNEEVDAGESLCIDDLARQLDVSTTPIRQALSRLESEGLIDLPPSRQPVVRGLTRQELNTLYDIRKLLEPYLMRRLSSLAVASQEVSEEIKDLLRDLRRGLGISELRGASRAPIKVDHRLGEILSVRLDDSLLARLLQLLNNYILRLRLTSVVVPAASREERLGEVAREHCELIEAVLDGDEKRIDRSIADHLSKSYARSVAALDGTQASPAGAGDGLQEKDSTGSEEVVTT